jgi:hypothetical protein
MKRFIPKLIEGCHFDPMGHAFSSFADVMPSVCRPLGESDPTIHGANRFSDRNDRRRSGGIRANVDFETGKVFRPGLKSEYRTVPSE